MNHSYRQFGRSMMPNRLARLQVHEDLDMDESQCKVTSNHLVFGRDALTRGYSFPVVHPNAATVSLTGATALTLATHYGLNLDNAGAGGTLQHTLPLASEVKGRVFRFYQRAAQITQLVPQTGEKIYLAGSGVATKYLNIAAVIGNYVDVYCDGVAHHVLNFSGVVTKEA